MNLDIPLDLYKIFCTVVRLGNMSLAAKELYISQPAVSMAVKQLEGRLGSPLLIRTTKGVHTTPEGNMIYDYVSQALNLIDIAEKKYLEMVNLDTGELSIGASDTIISKFLLPYLEEYKSLYSSINIRVTNRTSFGTIQLLKNGKVDLGFVNLPIKQDDSLEIFECFTIHDCLIGGSKFKELSQKGIQITELAQYPLLMLEEDSNTRKFINAYAQENGVALLPNIELGSSELLLEFASINLGLAFVIREFIDNQLGENLFEIPIAPEPKPRAVGLIKLKNVALSYAARHFMKLFHIN